MFVCAYICLVCMQFTYTVKGPPWWGECGVRVMSVLKTGQIDLDVCYIFVYVRGHTKLNGLSRRRKKSDSPTWRTAIFLKPQVCTVSDLDHQKIPHLL